MTLSESLGNSEPERPCEIRGHLPQPPPTPGKASRLDGGSTMRNAAAHRRLLGAARLAVALPNEGEQLPNILQFVDVGHQSDDALNPLLVQFASG